MLTASPVELDLQLPSGRVHAQRFGAESAPGELVVQRIERIERAPGREALLGKVHPHSGLEGEAKVMIAADEGTRL